MSGLEHDFVDLHISLDDIKAYVSTALDKQVAVVVRWPINGQTGVIAFEDDATATRIVVDPTVVAAAISDARAKQVVRDTPPPPRVQAGDILSKFAAATTDKDRLAALGLVLALLVDRETKNNSTVLTQFQQDKDARYNRFSRLGVHQNV